MTTTTRVWPRRDWVSVDEVIRTAVAELAAPADFTLSIDHDLPLVLLDAVQMERAFVNTFPEVTLRDLIEVKVASNWAGIKEKKKKDAEPCA